MMGNPLDINLVGGECNDSRKSIDIDMQRGGECSGGGSIDLNFGVGGLSCYPPCAHTHPIDSSAWGITVLDSAAWLGKYPMWNGSQFVPSSSSSGGVSSFNGRVGAVMPQLGDYSTDIVGEGLVNLYFTNSRAINSTLTGFTSGAGTITAADSVLSAIQKLNGNISGLVTGVSSVFGRTGAVTQQSGDYNTDLVPEGITNFYWTNARTINSVLSGYVSGAGTITAADSVLTAIQKLNGNITSIGTGYVPYTGATANVDLGAFDLNTQGIKITGVNGNGHLTLRWQSINPIAAGNHTTFFANNTGDLKYKIDGNHYTTFSTSANTSDRTYTFPDTNGMVPLGTGATNEIAYWTSANVLSSLNTGIYPSLTELSHVKGVTSTIQTQLNGKQPISANLTSLSGLSYVSTSFVKMTAAGTFALDTNTYLTAAITSLNGLTGSTQTFATGTSGSDFNISSTATTHTFNIPTASASNRGLLSTTDWTTFNNKQSTITIGTIDSQAKVANGLVLTSNILYTQTADATNVGMVSTGTQTFAGAKTFSNNAFSSVVISSGSYTNNNGSHFIVNPTITNNSASGFVAAQTISGTISAGANNTTHYGLNLNSTYNAGAFTGTVFYDLQLGRSNPNINYSSGNISFLSSGTINFILRGSAAGFTTTRGKLGNTTGTATNILDVGGDSLFGAAAATPATAGARVHIVGASASTGTALLVTNSTPTTILRVDNNQDLYLGSSGGKVGFYAVTPIVRPTTGIAGATRVGGAGTTVTTTDTYGGYTIAQMAQAMINLGLLT